MPLRCLENNDRTNSVGTVEVVDNQVSLPRLIPEPVFGVREGLLLNKIIRIIRQTACNESGSM